MPELLSFSSFFFSRPDQNEHLNCGRKKNVIFCKFSVYFSFQRTIYIRIFNRKTVSTQEECMSEPESAQGIRCALP